MMKIVTFKCNICKDDIGRTRKGMRKHFAEKHKRNNYFSDEKEITREVMNERDA